MQTTFQSSRILLPASPVFVFVTTLFFFFINCLPPQTWLWMPDFLVLVLIFWSIREQRYIGMGVSFFFGLLMDVADASLLGQHAFAYVSASYTAFYFSRRILWFTPRLQALHIFPILLGVQFFQAALRVLMTGQWPDGVYFLATPFFGTILWPLFSFLLLLPQHRVVDRDDNRPI